MSNEIELQNKIDLLENENKLLNEKVQELENIIKSYQSQNLYFDNINSIDKDIELDSPIFKSIPFIKRMNAFNYSNEEVNV